jgi:hypothetical protein
MKTADPNAARLIDTYARTFDVSETRVVLVDAHPAAVFGAVERLEPARTVVHAIEAVGLADRLALAPTRLASAKGEEHVYGMAGRLDGVPAERIDPHDPGAFDRPGYVKVIWDVRVEAGDETGTMSTTTRFVSTDHSSRERLGAAWGVLGPVSAALSKRALSAVKRYAEDQDELPSLGSADVPHSGRQTSEFALAALTAPTARATCLNEIQAAGPAPGTPHRRTPAVGRRAAPRDECEWSATQAAPL